MSNYKSIIIVCLKLFFSFKSFSQQYTQTLRGNIVDKILQSPLPGVAVVIVNSDPMKGTTTDLEGNFKLTEVPIGKQSLKISFIGYKSAVLQDVDITSGKEVVLSLEMEEDIIQASEIEVTADIKKGRLLNDLSFVSSRSFSVEETQKYAAAFNDPARMALAFPGVVQAGDIKNDLSIRGNSPNGLLWKMEGVDIPNPNHFSYVGTSGGGISILSSQLLTNSDFMTSAFPAEYGNALSGVFDLKLRKGNNEKREYTTQLSLLGIDFIY